MPKSKEKSSLHQENNMSVRKEPPCVPEDAFVLFKDEGLWCCVGLDFNNLQDSPVGYAKKPKKAIRAYQIDALAQMEVMPTQLDLDGVV